MRNVLAQAGIFLAVSGIAYAQGRPLDWSFYGGDAQRTGWEKSDSRITKENIKDFQLVLKRKLENGQGGQRSLSPPVVIGNLISYKGFKELGFVSGSSDTLWSIDVDVDRIFWQKRLVPSKVSSAIASGTCSAVVTATPSLTPPMNFAARPRPAAPAPVNAAPPKPRGILGTGAFGEPRPAFALSSDGKLHLLNTSNGDDLVPPISFIPANGNASSLALSDGVIYTTTDSRCGGATGVWALDLSNVDPKSTSMPHASSFLLKGGNISSLGGVAFGTDGTLYVQASELLALKPKDLTLRQSFTVSAAVVTPVVFAHAGHDLIVTAGSDGSLYLLDDHLSLVSRTSSLTPSGGNIWGGLSSWQDADGTRWVLAPVWGPEKDASKGSIVAFKLEAREGKPVLTQAWVSRDMISPEPPVITSGVVFALSAGAYPSGHATLYALDALTGKEMYSTGDQVSAPGNLTGMSIANGRVYFTTSDNTLYAFGIFLER